MRTIAVDQIRDAICRMVRHINIIDELKKSD